MTIRVRAPSADARIKLRELYRHSTPHGVPEALTLDAPHRRANGSPTRFRDIGGDRAARIAPVAGEDDFRPVRGGRGLRLGAVGAPDRAGRGYAADLPAAVETHRIHLLVERVEAVPELGRRAAVGDNYPAWQADVPR